MQAVIAVVFDTGVLISAIGWRGPAHRCLALVARRRCRLAISADINAEYESRVPAVLAEEAPQANAHGALAWVRAKALWVEGAPLGKQRSRDLKDERFIAAALAANAKAIVSYDSDLLALQKPFAELPPPSSKKHCKRTVSRFCRATRPRLAGSQRVSASRALLVCR